MSDPYLIHTETVSKEFVIELSSERKKHLSRILVVDQVSPKKKLIHKTSTFQSLKPQVHKSFNYGPDESLKTNHA